MGLGFAACLALGLSIGAARAQATLPPFDQAPYTHPQRLVTVAPGRTLNLYCTGHGTPAVILDSGWGGPTYAWAYVQPAVAGFTEVCSYDRAGQGFSDAGPLPRDTDALVGDLHGLLHAAGIKSPYVFVGHSIAGLDGVLFADRYLGELAGMVLVDPAFAHQVALMSRIAGMDAVMRKTTPDLTPCEAAARAHRLPTAPKLVDLCLDHNPVYTPALVAAMDRMDMRPGYWSDLESEVASSGNVAGAKPLDPDSRELDRASRSFGSLPLIVLTAGNRSDLPGLSPAQADALFEVWNHGHDMIASRSSRGRNQLVPNSGHYIQFYQPKVVVDAIRELVTGSRREAGRHSDQG
jgi:pimeloyl-ACP methyl ester carboxylesterase